MVKNMIYRQVKGQILIKDDLRQHSHELNTENMIYCTMNSFEHKNLIQNIVLDCFILLQRIYKTLHSPADRFLYFFIVHFIILSSNFDTCRRTSHKF